MSRSEVRGHEVFNSSTIANQKCWLRFPERLDNAIESDLP